MNLNDKTASFSLIRTSSQITGNVKITIDSSADIWLNTIDSNDTLSSSRYKRYAINPESTYEHDLQALIGNLDPAVVFDVLTVTDVLHTSKTFDTQYDLFYAMGAAPNLSPGYTEDYSYFAPIWLREQLPDYFVIMRIDEPLDFPYNANVSSGSIITGVPTKYKVVSNSSLPFNVVYESITYATGTTFISNISTTYTVSVGTGSVVNLNENKDLPINYKTEFNSIMQKAYIIKTFDLTATSKIGKYIRNIMNNPQLPESPITVRFETGSSTEWNGVSYQDGIITSKGEILDALWAEEKTQIDFEEYITQGFQRHGIIPLNMLNLEFLFSDNTTPLYSIPRYLGFYVSKTQTGTFQLDGQKMFNNIPVSGNTPAPTRPNKGFYYQDQDFYQNNANGVRLYYMNQAGFIPNSSLFDPTNFQPRFYWVQDRLGNFHTPDPTGVNTYGITNTDIVLRDTQLNLGQFAGGGSVLLQDKGAYLADKGRSYMVIQVDKQLFPNDKIRMYWNIGSQGPMNGRYDEITANDLSKRPFTVIGSPAVELVFSTGISYTSGTLIIGTSYCITLFNAGDDFSNVGGTNVTGDTFTATGTTPATWTNSSSLLICLDLRTEFELNQTIQIYYGSNNTMSETIISAPTFTGGNTHVIVSAPVPATSGTTPIVPGWGPGSAMTSNNFDPVYFHPYGTTQQVATAIAKAFNLIEDRTFDAVVMPDYTNPASYDVVIRLKEGASVTNSFFCTANLYDNTTITMQSTTITGSIQKVFFEGGTDLSTIRLRFSLTATDILDTPNVWVKSQNGYAKIVSIGRYVDDARLNPGTDVIGSLHDFDNYGVFYIDNPLDKPLIGSMNDYIVYNLFEISTGVFSMFNIKDLDGDFYDSTYARSPINEYYRYFNVQPSSTLIIGRKYLVLGTGTDVVTYNFITYNASTNGTEFVATIGGNYQVSSGSPFVVPEIFYNSAVSPYDTLVNLHEYLVLGNPLTDSINYSSPSYPNPIPAGYDYVWSPGNTFIAASGYPNYTINSGSPTVIDLNNYTLDPDLAAFPGFQTLKAISPIANEQNNNSGLTYTNKGKFFFNDINSEYDYLNENYTKEAAVNSRVVPVISKWVYQGGTDVRDNPYRLNVHAAFGTYNFSPSLFIQTQSPDAFTHEWYYLEGSPQQYPAAFVDDNYYFFPDKIEGDSIRAMGMINGPIANADPSTADAFTNYFTYQTSLDANDQERYVLFQYNIDLGLCEALFRGAQIQIKEVIQDARITEVQGIKPPFAAGSTRFLGSKFSCLLRVFKESPDLIESPVMIHFVENKTFKTVTMFVDILLDDYRTLTLEDPANLGQLLGSPSVEYPDTLDSTVDYLLLYSMRSKRSEALTDGNTSPTLVQGLDANKVGNIKFSVGLNLASPSVPGPNGITITVFDNPTYDWDLRDELKNFIPAIDPLDPGNYMYGTFRYGSTLFTPPIGVSQTQMLFPSLADFQAPVGHSIFVPYGSPFEWQDPSFVTYQSGGGNLYYEPIMQRISFARMADKINNYSQYITYRTYTWNPTTATTVETVGEYYAEFEPPTQINTNSSLIPQADLDIPQELKMDPIIGVDLVSVQAASALLRFSGPYEPKFRDVLYFAGQKDDQIMGSSPTFDLSFQQATFNPNVPGFGVLSNFFYSKVANNDILALVNDQKYPSLYPLVNEVAIDRKEFQVFKSSWDPGFYTIYTNKSTFNYQAGTRDMKELKNFLGTKIMKTQDSITLPTFSVLQVPDVTTVNPNSVTAELIWSISGNVITGYVNLQSRLLRYLVEDPTNGGAGNQFEEYLMPEFGVGNPIDLTDTIDAYLNLNVIPDYAVNTANMFVYKYQNTPVTPIQQVVGNLTDAQKLLGGYVVEANFTVKQVSNLEYSFKFTIPTGYNVSIAPSFILNRLT